MTSSRVDTYYCPSDPNSGKRAGLARRDFAKLRRQFRQHDQQPDAVLPVPWHENAVPGRAVHRHGAPDPDITSASASKPTHGGTVNFSGITDGLSSTMLVSEVVVGSGGDRRGFSWWGYAAQFTGLQPPNSSSPDVLQSSRYCGECPSQPPVCRRHRGQQRRSLYRTWAWSTCLAACTQAALTSAWPMAACG